jgi:hypothetical protein
MISGRTTLIAHFGHPTESCKAPMIYNPWFEQNGIDAVVVPMGVGPEDYPAFLSLIFDGDPPKNSARRREFRIKERCTSRRRARRNGRSADG